MASGYLAPSLSLPAATVFRSIERLKHWTVKRLASSYIAGPDLADALDVCRRVRQFGLSSIVCSWDGPSDTPKSVAANYEEALRAIIREGLPCYLSVKLPALDYSAEKVARLLEIAREGRVRIHFDSQRPDSAEPTMRLIERLAPRHRNIGCTLPSRWLRSDQDAERAINAGVAVRLVKGHWADPQAPDLDPQARLLDLVNILAGRATHVAVATHDVRLARESMIRLRDAGTPCELEQLLGLPLSAAKAARSFGVKVRVYVAYGQAWLPYCLSEVSNRPEILRWILRDFCQGARGKLIELRAFV